MKILPGYSILHIAIFYRKRRRRRIHEAIAINAYISDLGLAL